MGSKKGHATAKKHDLNFGNRKTGCTKLSFQQSMCNVSKDGRNLAVLLSILKSGIEAYHLIFNALEAEYSPFFLSDFQEGFNKEMESYRND